MTRTNPPKHKRVRTTLPKKVKQQPRSRPTTTSQRIKNMNTKMLVDKKIKKETDTNFRKRDLPIEARWWEARSTSGRRPIFKTPNELYKACIEYIRWAEENPYYEYKVCGLDHGVPIIEYIPKKRPLTIGMLSIFLDISVMTWGDYKNNKGEGFSYICNTIDEMIREQKFGGAASGFFNHAIIARDLGLTDKRELTGAEGRPLIPPEQNDERAKQSRLQLLAVFADDEE